MDLKVNNYVKFKTLVWSVQRAPGGMQPVIAVARRHVWLLVPGALPKICYTCTYYQYTN